MASFLDQSPYRGRLDWGARGVERACKSGDIVVVVDVLSFSTTVATAIIHGGVIHPCDPVEDIHALAQTAGGIAAVGRRDVPAKGRYSLSPLTFIDMEPGASVWLASPNGAACARHAGEAYSLFVGALANAGATASAVSRALNAPDIAVTVIACGELGPEGELRFAIEDYLGAGAILSELPLDRSPEAEACAAGYLACRERLADLIWCCASGRELRERGFDCDVRHSAQLDIYDEAVLMRDGRLMGPTVKSTPLSPISLIKLVYSSTKLTMSRLAGIMSLID